MNATLFNFISTDAVSILMAIYSFARTNCECLCECDFFVVVASSTFNRNSPSFVIHTYSDLKNLPVSGSMSLSFAQIKNSKVSKCDAREHMTDPETLFSALPNYQLRKKFDSHLVDAHSTYSFFSFDFINCSMLSIECPFAM